MAIFWPLRPFPYRAYDFPQAPSAVYQKSQQEKTEPATKNIAETATETASKKLLQKLQIGRKYQRKYYSNCLLAEI